MEDIKVSSQHYEADIEPELLKEPSPPPEDFDGDVNLSGPDGLTYLIPTPSADPRGSSWTSDTRLL